MQNTTANAQNWKQGKKTRPPISCDQNHSSECHTIGREKQFLCPILVQTLMRCLTAFLKVHTLNINEYFSIYLHLHFRREMKLFIFYIHTYIKNTYSLQVYQ